MKNKEKLGKNQVVEASDDWRRQDCLLWQRRKKKEKITHTTLRTLAEGTGHYKYMYSPATVMHFVKRFIATYHRLLDFSKRRIYLFTSCDLGLLNKLHSSVDAWLELIQRDHMQLEGWSLFLLLVNCAYRAWHFHLVPSVKLTVCDSQACGIVMPIMSQLPSRYFEQNKKAKTKETVHIW